jgi:uncharacterized repeat protein (TIGR01451 family)
MASVRLVFSALSKAWNLFLTFNDTTMKSSLLTLLFLFFGHGFVIAQCPTGDVIIYDEAALADYVAQYSGCTALPGSLEVLLEWISDEQSILSLSVFDTIETVNGNLWVYMYIPNEESYPGMGFSNLQQVHGKVDVGEYNGTASLFPSLIRIDSSLTFEFTSMTTNDLMPNVKTIGGDLVFNGSYFIVNSAFDQLDSVYGGFDYYWYADFSIDQQPLNSLEYIGGDLRYSMVIEPETQLEFNALKSIGGDLFLGDMNSFLDFIVVEPWNAFQSLESIGGKMEMSMQGVYVDSMVQGNFDVLSQVGGNITINNLDNIPTFPSLLSIDSSIILHNVKNTKPMIFDNLSHIGGKLSFGNSNTVQPAFQHLGEINGDLSVAMFDFIDGSDFSFQSLKRIEGTLVTSFSGDGPQIGFEFDSLKFCKMILFHNSNEYMLSKFNQLDSVGRIYLPFHMSSISGFQRLKYAESIECGGNSGTFSITGFDSLTTAGDFFIFSDVNDISGLSSLKEVNGRFGLYSIESLPSLSALSNLEKVGSLEFLGASLINSLAPLNSLIHCGELHLYQMDQLVSIDGLENLELGTEFYLHNNPLLSDCNHPAVCYFLASEDSYGPYDPIEDNATDCLNRNEAAANCEGQFAHVSGDVYIDLDCSNSQDSLEPILLHHILVNENDQIAANAGMDGRYHKVYFYDANVVLAAQEILGFTAQPLAYTMIADSSSNVNLYGYDFSFCPDSAFQELGVDLIPVSYLARPGYLHHQMICYENRGSLMTDAQLVYTLSGDAIDHITFDSTANGIVEDNQVSWDLADVALFDQQCFYLSLYVDSTAAIGSSFDAVLTISSDDVDADYSNNVDSMHTTIWGSYDPNDKTVDKPYIEALTVTGPQELTYTIRFQNTGTLAATTVYILDTLESRLDVNTIRLIASSHPYELTANGNILKFLFEDINLPDSTSNELMSHGFIRFSVKTSELQDFSEILNDAAIYFDYNTPVITNNAVTSFFSPTFELVPSLDLRTMPNPTTGTTYLTLKTESNEPIMVEVFNALGAQVQFFEREMQPEFKLDLTSLTDGLYVVRVVQGNLTGSTRVLKQR